MQKVEVQIDLCLSKELVVGNKIFRSACDFRLTERDLEKARKELKETEEKRRTYLQELKKMLFKDKRMRYRMDDDYLLRYLRFRKFDVQEAYKIIQHFYSMRNEDPLLFTLPTDVELKLKGKLANLMPYTSDDGEVVYIHRIGYWNPSEVSVRDLCVMFSYVSDVLSMNPHAQINGVSCIHDYEGVTVGQLSYFLHPSAIQLWTKMFQEVYPWRVKKLVFFNVSAVLFSSLYFARCFLKKKIADRIVLIRSGLVELHKHFNPAILPKEYGGNLDDEECCSYLKKVIFSNKEYLRYENSFIGYNE